MGATCCRGSRLALNQDHHEPKLTAEDIEERKRRQAEAADKRQKDFKQGGGGEKLKAKSKALEEAEKKNKELGGPNLKWTVS